ncbi:MarR family winged helix-turn-helix transcriptional regulator [Furfurilactobacillus sp. WILCCON 0119]
MQTTSETSAWRDLIKQQRRVNQLNQHFVREYGLTLLELTYLKIIDQVPDISSTELADNIGVSLSAVSSKVVRMVDHGLVVMAFSQTDRRVKKLCLTEKGREMLTQIKHNRDLTRMDIRI